MNYFFISDTHFGHKNIVKGVSEWPNTDNCRPFSTVEDHDNTIIENINSVVNKDDILIHAGDWSFGNIENVRKFRELIQCRSIWLVKGNHDYKLWRTEQHHFYRTDKLIDDLCIDKQKIVVCHYSLQVWEDNNRGSWMIHGHSHNNLDHSSDGKILDVCPEGHDYKPWSFEQIREYMNQIPTISKDHH